MANLIELEKKENKKNRMTQSLCINRERSFKSNSSLKDKFFHRQEHFIRNLGLKRQIISKKNNESEEVECTFSPKIYSKIENDQPASLRLYNDNLRRSNNKHILNKIREIKYRKRSLSPSNNNDDLKKFEEMYLEYKKRSARLDSLRRSQDKELGITFQPNLCNNSNIHVSSSFSERNFLDKKPSFKKEKELDLLNSPKVKKVSPQEYEEIGKGIVERLYKREVEKRLERNKNIEERENSFEKKNEKNISFMKKVLDRNADVN